MVDITVTDIPEALYAALQERARSTGRSIEDELLGIIHTALGEPTIQLLRRFDEAVDRSLKHAALERGLADQKNDLLTGDLGTSGFDDDDSVEPS